jgi:hypothetical protein
VISMESGSGGGVYGMTHLSGVPMLALGSDLVSLSMSLGVRETVERDSASPHRTHSREGASWNPPHTH